MAYNEWDEIFPSILGVVSEGGFHAASVSRVVAASGVAKMTLYKHFGSRDALFAALLEWHSAQWREWFFGEVEDQAEKPAHRLVAFFDVLEAWLTSSDFEGCVFAHALSDFPDPGHPVHQAAAQHKDVIRQRLRAWARKAGAAKPAQLALRLELLMEGAAALRERSPRSRAAGQACVLARWAIRDALPGVALPRARS